jgi:hypothetical protein
MMQDSSACYSEQRKALCPALKVFKEIWVLKYGGIRREADTARRWEFSKPLCCWFLGCPPGFTQDQLRRKFFVNHM